MKPDIEQISDIFYKVYWRGRIYEVQRSLAAIGSVWVIRQHKTIIDSASSPELAVDLIQNTIRP